MIKPIIPPDPRKQGPQRRYAFNQSPSKPDYIQVIDLQGPAVVAEFYIEHAMVVCAMYQNLVQHNAHAANEFMYGHILGMTYAMLHADKYPKTTVVTVEGRTFIRMENPNGTVQTIDPENTPDMPRQLHEQALKAGVGNKG